MTWQEISDLFNSIATGLSLTYEEGAFDKINATYPETDKYPFCYALPGILLNTGDSAQGPEAFAWRYWDCQILFLDIYSTTKVSPDMNHTDTRELRSRMIEKAMSFKYNLYEGNLVDDNISILDWEIKQFETNKTADAAFGAILEFRMRTLDNLDCDDVI